MFAFITMVLGVAMVVDATESGRTDRHIILEAVGGLVLIAFGIGGIQ